MPIGAAIRTFNYGWDIFRSLGTGLWFNRFIQDDFQRSPALTDSQFDSAEACDGGVGGLGGEGGLGDYLRLRWTCHAGHLAGSECICGF
jgi:hypothetical protein